MAMEAKMRNKENPIPVKQSHRWFSRCQMPTNPEITLSIIYIAIKIPVPDIL